MKLTEIKIQGQTDLTAALNPGDSLQDAMAEDERLVHGSKHVWMWRWKDGVQTSSAPDAASVLLTEDVDIIGAVKEKHRPVRKVTITVPGADPRTVRFQMVATRDGMEPEKLYDVLSRLNVKSWSDAHVTEWWLDGHFTEYNRGKFSPLSDGMNIVGTTIRLSLGVPMIRIMITGSSPRQVPILAGETMSDLVARLSSLDFPLNKVRDWYCNWNEAKGYDALPEPDDFILSNGDLIAGAPRCH